MTDTPADIPPESTGPKEGLDFRGDGTIHVWIDGTNYPLRRPKGREFRQLRESLQAKVDDINDRLVPEGNRIKAELLAAIEQRVKDGGSGEMTPEETRRDRDEGRRINDERERVGGSWWLDLIDMLGDRNGLEYEDLPAWMLDVEDVFIIVLHWRSIPSLSGGR